MLKSALETPDQSRRPAQTDTQIKWSFQLHPDEPRLRCMKLMLVENAALPRYVSKSQTIAQLRKSGKLPVDTVADYLTELYKH